MKSDSKKLIDILRITLYYAIATFFAVKLFKFFSDSKIFSFYINILVVDIIATFIIFCFSCIKKNASVYDPYWSVQPIVILSCLFLGANSYLGTSPSYLAIYLFCIICFWGIRLTVNWAYTFKNLKSQDWRYTMLKEKTKKFYPFVNFFGIHLVPTLIVYACTIPAIYAINIPLAKLNVYSIIFGAISICAVILQGISDYQMHKFRKEKASNPETTPQFIRNGLWKYSRHPNYLGEIIMWWGISLSVVSAVPERWYLIAGAFINTCLFLFISIPMADKRQSQKQGFDEYKKQTRMLLPIAVNKKSEKSN